MTSLINIENIQSRIVTIRGKQIMIDRDLSDLYGVETKVLNQAVKRNIKRFPDNFRFQLTDTEKIELVTNCDRFKKLKHSSTNPYAFTEQGVAMLSAVLHSQTAIEISIRIIEAFIEMRNFITTNAAIFQRLDKIEKKQLESDSKFEQLFQAIEDKNLKPKQGIFFDGQIFDAYTFISELIKKAKESIVLIDNYIDESVLVLLSKNPKVNVTIYTKKITKQIKLDIAKYNQQFSPLSVKEFKSSHDRFLILDNKEVYHFGASLKDLGKKWFAFSKFELGVIDILNRLEKEKVRNND